MIWLYTEDRSPLVEGPFPRLEMAFDSSLWARDHACVWIERKDERGGWVYENAKWCGDHWFTTSSGLRPLAPIRPAVIEDQGSGAK